MNHVIPLIRKGNIFYIVNGAHTVFLIIDRIKSFGYILQKPKIKNGYVKEITGYPNILN
jgi:hypothetical protein